MGSADVGGIEDHIRTVALTKRIRPSEFFLDYDRLRSGNVTETQFFRVLWENLGIKLSEDEQLQLSQKYDLKGDGRMNYRKFCTNINQPFDADDLLRDPSEQHVQPQELLGTTRSLRPLSPKDEGRIEQLLRQLREYYKYHGINLRTCCEDFDRHHIGVIQQSQFYRSFPRPSEVTEEDMELLVRKYSDPTRRGLMNYLNLHNDLEAVHQSMTKEGISTLPSVPNVSSYLPTEPGADNTLQQIFDRMRVAVHKNRVRTIEFFKDYDKLRSGIITENQFVCGLSLALGKEAQLSRPEIQKVSEYYRIPDGRVRYKEFCDMMENAFNIPDLEKKPTQEVVRPPQGLLGRNLPMLEEREEIRVRAVLDQLAEQASKRRLMMYQYFKDFDRSKGYSRLITPTQFGRILHFLSLNVAPEDFKLLCRKFADPTTNDVNYPAFVQTVDHEFVNYTQEPPTGLMENKESYDSETTLSKSSEISLDDLMARVRSLVLTNRRRVCEYFQDFDPLRSGSITKSQFRRGLSDLGLSALGQHNLTTGQFDMLCQVYQDTKMADKVLWTLFMNDIESVFTQPELEKNPSQQVPPHEVFVVPKPGTMDWHYSSDEHKQLMDDVMGRLRARVKQRRVLAKPVFQDFDRHNNGHVTRSQFRQCLNMLELHCDTGEMQALEAKFCNDTGFCYLNFLQELEPRDVPKMMYVERMKDIRQTNQKSRVIEFSPAKDLEGVLNKIKTKVFKERVRIHDWVKDYDKLRSGKMLKSNFRRALDLCKFELTQSELDILEDYYQSPDEEYVEYVRFVDDIEGIFTTKNLEKTPLLEVTQFQPPVEWQQNKLSDESNSILEKCMARLAEKVRKHRMQLFPLFEDYDRVHNGTVTTSQFRRVLSELELASMVGEQEWICLFKNFDVVVGGKDVVNYNAFCDEIYELANFEWRKP